MTIRYVLFENHLTSDPNDYAAKVITTDTAEFEDVVERMIQSGSTVTKADIFSVLEDYFSAVEYLALEGMSVTTPITNFSVSLRGVFDGPDDAYDASRHQVAPVTSPGKRLWKAIRERARTAKGEALSPQPNPVAFNDINTGERNGQLTPNGMAQVSGHRLKFDQSDPEQGIFFIAADGTETRVAVVGKNKPADLMFLAPALTAGDYTLAVRTKLLGEDLRAGQLTAVLTVS